MIRKFRTRRGEVCLLIAFIAPVIGVGCNTPRAALYRIAPDETEVSAREYLEVLRTGELEDALKPLDKSIDTNETRQALDQIRNLLRHPHPPDSIELVGAHVTFGNRGRDVALTYQIQHGQKWMAAEVVFHEENQIRTVRGLQVTPLEKSFQEIHGFRLRGKSFGHYFMLFWILLTVGFIIHAVRLCFRADLKRKWLWILLALVTVMDVNLNWTDGSTSLRILAVRLFGFGFFKGGPAAPLILTVGFPIGAILAIRKAQSSTGSRSMTVSDEMEVISRESNAVSNDTETSSGSPEEWVVRALLYYQSQGLTNVDAQAIRKYVAERAGTGLSAGTLAEVMAGLEEIGKVRRIDAGWTLSREDHR